ncbi:hypothetical protein [Dickeya sp. ws52]|uniref:phosphoribosyltransferase-like protein n=1 Tax=Dickeya sp. ws52 TaxID=2576377 RepID=UPI00117F9FE0|nr:hypothetical protein [Dickeya sp. ws52]TYL43491.1 hypothetical protein FDP13_05940 [Dickeya sp. ws52]
MDELIEKVVSIIFDYRKDDSEFDYHMNNDHVKCWVEQFNDIDREFVLEQTVNLFSKNYFNKEKYKKFLGCASESDKFTRDSYRNFWSDVSLLSIQKDGNSQNEMNEILRGIVDIKYGVTVAVNDMEKNHYIYVDDFLFSGNRIEKDIKEWLDTKNKNNFHLDILLFGYYSYGKYKLYENLKSISGCRNFNLIIWKKDNLLSFENSPGNKNSSENFWPMHTITDSEEINDYILSEERYIRENNKKSKIIYRDFHVKSKTFNCESEVRERYERILYESGCRILSRCHDRQPTFRPLGYSIFPGHGFGGTIFTYRNCPNNAPLAFWWGGKDENTWYPLLPRKVYKRKSEIFDFF